MTFEFEPDNLDQIIDLVKMHRANGAIIKPLSKNHNDKNQVYSGSDFKPLFPYFDLTFDERVGSTSAKKNGAKLGTPILEAVFNEFRWATTDGGEVPSRNVKMIIYPQYPEARLSGFKTVENTMPASMSVEFTKRNPDIKRYLVLARRGKGAAVGFMVVDRENQLADDISQLPNAPKSRVWKQLQLGLDASSDLLGLLTQAASRDHFGCRLNKDGETIPFNGTQVCGYTLEQACGIIPNSDKDGDYEGIELKTHTQKKVTLFTPEPDLGAYADSFNDFMLTYGYQDKNGAYRITGIHRTGVKCNKSNLTLEIRNYDPDKSLASQVGKDIIVGLYDDRGALAAGWSLRRLLNCWGAKHNEVVYIPASKSDCRDKDMLAKGYRHVVSFDRQVKWCRHTSADKMLQAIWKGTIFLDPAPKCIPDDLSKSKRRSQWRVNDIGRAIHDLYDHVEEVSL